MDNNFDAQMAVLSRIAYLDMPDIVDHEKMVCRPPKTLAEFVEYYSDPQNQPKGFEKDGYSKAFKMIMADPYLKSLKVAGFDSRTMEDGSCFAAYCFENTSGDAVVAFRGSDSLPDYLTTGDYAADPSVDRYLTSQQKAAEEFMKKTPPLGAGGYDKVSVTGHSLGGMLAQHVTLMDLDNKVNSCTTFNAPGFSVAYTRLMEQFIKSVPEIENNAKKIKAYRAKNDIVSLLGCQLVTPITAKGVGGAAGITGKIEDHYLSVFIDHYYDKGNYVNQFNNSGGGSDTCPLEDNSGYQSPLPGGGPGLVVGGGRSTPLIVPIGVANAGGNQKIKLNHPATLAIATKMKSNATAFGSNQQKLVRAVAALGSSWSGNVSNAMQSELQDMNQNVANIQATLSELAEFALKSANLLKDVDTALGKGISGTV